ncbi:MAG: polysaccharide deacetylase family protein [Erysipelotrichaceae bacterium]|nr:polysaccharide deacetylase family protein [Erysipelotrichaceae bacterium]
MKTRSKAVKSNRFKLYLILVLTLSIVTIMGFMFSSSQKRLDIPKEISVSKNISGYQAIYQQDDDHTIAAYYPLLTQREITTQLIEFIDYKISSFIEEDEKYLYIDYDLYKVTDQYLSVAFFLAHGNDLDELKLDLIKTLSFKADTEELITLNDVFRPEYEESMMALLRKTLKNDKDYQDNLRLDFYQASKVGVINLEYYVFDQDHLRLMVDSKALLSDDIGLINIDLNVKDLAYYLIEDYRAIDVIKPSTDKDLTLRYIDPDQPMVALTYDDGPYGPVTDDIVATLAEYESVATFFVVGNRIKTYSDTLLNMIDCGNEIGNHSYTHKYNLTKIDQEKLNEELSFTQRDLYHYVNDYRIRLLRPTGGNHDQTLRDNCGYPIINWSVDTKDWQHHQSQRTYEEIVNVAKDGDIIIMHDIYPSTAEATKMAVPKLIEMGYQLVTVSELYEYKGITLENGTVYYASDRYKK